MDEQVRQSYNPPKDADKRTQELYDLAYRMRYGVPMAYRQIARAFGWGDKAGARVYRLLHPEKNNFIRRSIKEGE